MNTKTNQVDDQSDSEEVEPALPFLDQKGQQIMNPIKAPTKKRGRKAIAVRWSRIIDPSQNDAEELELFEIETDMAQAANEVVELPKRSKHQW